MRLYDTRTRRRVDLALGHTVRVYTCGITPYASAHLGHAFTYASVDALVRWLTARGHRVLSVRNVTDVDDDILRVARERGEDYLTLGQAEVERFDRDLAALGLLAPTAVPRPTRAIPAIRAAVRGLLDSGSAYALPDGRVYFDTAASATWGTLSRLDAEEMLRQFAAKGGDPDATGKRAAVDFLLWQPSAAREPSWESPVPDCPPGRPGWHIECSAMVMEELGGVLDIHAGGSDLVFPHHEAEIQQAEHLTGQGPFARAWFHVGLVGLDGEKMSKSLGNLVFVRDLLERYEAGAVRRHLLEHHYRSPWEYDEVAMAQSAGAHKVWTDAAARGGERPDLEERFAAAMEDDLDTPAAVAVLDEAAQAGAGTTLRRLGGVLGFAFPPSRDDPHPPLEDS
jgi:L-cysteine:1D-myo-inositol 2-amino-2-deoxy-alpha-D-glucopyranoside ligase